MFVNMAIFIFLHIDFASHSHRMPCKQTYTHMISYYIRLFAWSHADDSDTTDERAYYVCILQNVWYETWEYITLDFDNSWIAFFIFMTLRYLYINICITCSSQNAIFPMFTTPIIDMSNLITTYNCNCGSPQILSFVGGQWIYQSNYDSNQIATHCELNESIIGTHIWECDVQSCYKSLCGISAWVPCSHHIHYTADTYAVMYQW